MLPRFLVLATFPMLIALGCAGKLREDSAIYVGCQPDEIDIENDVRDETTITWEAKCNRRWYRCTKINRTVNCQHFRRRGGFLAQFSSGLIGCDPEEVEIDDESERSIWGGGAFS